jgi:hypothetical protein
LAGPNERAIKRAEVEETRQCGPSSMEKTNTPVLLLNAPQAYLMF